MSTQSRPKFPARPAIRLAKSGMTRAEDTFGEWTGVLAGLAGRC
jgi:hypothetical protein